MTLSVTENSISPMKSRMKIGKIRANSTSDWPRSPSLAPSRHPAGGRDHRYGSTRWTGLPRMSAVQVVTSFEVPFPFIV